MKALKSYNTEAITRFHQRKVHNTEIVESPQDDPPGPPIPQNDPPDLPESDLDIPDDPILDFVNSQCHNSEDLDQALQAYQAYQVPSPQDSTMTPERSINHHFTYHIAQASQAKHGSLVDRGANGGLAGSDVRILSRSSRKCTVTGIDSHELQGLDVVQCAALVQTNYGIVNLIMNEYACYGKGHTIHSSGQIEWFKNSVDDRSVQVGGKQRICTIDGYAMPLTYRGGLMYLSILGKPTDKDLERYPAVHLTGPHEWDPSVLDYTHPSGEWEPPWFVKFWGLPPRILFYNTSTGWFGRFVLSTECHRTRKLGYNNLNWPRCSARVTGSLALTDGGFCRKQTLYISDYVNVVSL